ncbi:hypothetical protein KBD08_02980 [Candidatus Babeliales bacterium]|nr:hypothetical protein [Candidatus Babeliales bacterium]
MKFLKLLIAFALACSTLYSMQTRFFNAAYLADNKVRFHEKNLTTLQLDGVHIWSSQAYDTHNYKTFLLSYAGPEALLARFVDPTLSAKDNTVVSYSYIDGHFASNYLVGTFIQNIGSHFFIQLSSSLMYDSLSKVVFIPCSKNGRLLSQQEIDQNPALEPYLEKLYASLFTNPTCPQQHAQFVGPTYGLIGYTTSFTDTQYIDFVDFSIVTGFIAPRVCLSTDSCFYLLGHQDRVNFGIPVQLNATVGLYDWLNIGASGTVIGFIENDLYMPLNTTNSDNAVLFNQVGFCNVHHKPFFSLNAYIEGEYFLPRWTWLIGLTYAQQYKTCYQAYNTELFPTETINNHPNQFPWQSTFVTFSSEFDLAQLDKKLMPRCKVSYMLPVHGTSILKTNMFAGQVGFEMKYAF